MEKVFAQVKILTGLPEPVVLPSKLPSNKTLAKAWLTALSETHNQVNITT